MTDADPYSDLIPGARAFLADLERNNERAWFNDHKTRYKSELKAPAERLLQHLEGPLSARAGADVAPKLFRPQRDVRFSKDKTPYHTHLHMLWAGPGGIGWFFGISPDYVSAGAGVMTFDKTQLTKYRTAVDGPEGAALADIVTRLVVGQGLRMDPPQLKRVPAPYDKDHSRGELLRRKSIALWRDDPQDEGGDLVTALLAAFDGMQPLVMWLRSNL